MNPQEYERFADKSSWAQEQERKMKENQHKSNSSGEAGCSGCFFLLLILAFFIGSALEQCSGDKKPRTQSRQRVRQVQSSKKPAATLVSQDGNLKIRQLRSYQDACATGQPSDSYYVKNGVSGVLYPSECGQYGTDAAKYKFVDTSGNERCTGKAVIAFGGLYGGGAKAVTYWEIKDAVSGYNCSTIGETYEIGMRSAQ